MALEPWHKVMEPVHHTDPRCALGIASRGIYQRPGTGGKPLCEECARLSSADQAALDTSDQENRAPG
jgi:hypothetical protein